MMVASRTGKATAIRRTAVRGTGVSQPLIEGPPEAPLTSQHYGIEGFKGGFQSGPHYAERRQFFEVFFSSNI